MAQRLLDGFNTRVFVQQSHAQDAAGVGIDEQRQPQTGGFAPGLFVDNPRIKQPMVGKYVLEGKLCPVNKGLEHEVEVFPQVLSQAFRHELCSLVRLGFDIFGIAVEPPR
jgi:hypothetical protein